jgi:hypothetical protein
MSSSPWRADPNLAGQFHAEYPDDLQVLVHDGELRRTKIVPEACWVRVQGVHGLLRMPVAPGDAEPPLTPDLVTWTERLGLRGDTPERAGEFENGP